MRDRLWISLILVVLTLAPFGQVLNYDFVDFDDNICVTDNPHLRMGLSISGVKWAFETIRLASWHPLTWVSYLLDHDWYGLRPSGYHLTNLLLHTANVLLLFNILTGFTGAPRKSALVALLFAIHPLHVESVAWVSERKGLLSALFWLLSMGAYWAYVRRPGLWRYVLVIALFVFGLMSKPMVVSLPIILLLLDWWPLNRLSFRGSAAQWRMCLLEKIPLVILAVGASFITWLAQEAEGTTRMLDPLPLGLCLENALISWRDYLTMTIMPTGLSCFYPYRHDSTVWQAALAGVTLLAITLAVLTGHRHRYLATGWFWYVVTLIPVIGLVQVGRQSMADRYTYLPLIGLFIMAAWGIPGLLDRITPTWRSSIRIQSVLRIGGGILLLLLAFRTWDQIQYWKTSVNLFSHAIEVTADNDLAHYDLGGIFQKQGRLTEAALHYREAVRINPKYAEAWNNWGQVLAQQGLHEEALGLLKQATAADPSFSSAWCNLGACLGSLGRLEEACQVLCRAITLKPDAAEAWYNLAITLEKRGCHPQAKQAFQQAARLGKQ